MALWPAGILRTKLDPIDAEQFLFNGANEPVTLSFVNATASSFTLCWVDESTENTLCHYYRVNAAHGPDAIEDGSVTPDHTEFSSLGDFFVMYWPVEGTNIEALGDIPRDHFIASYRPTAKVVGSSQHVITVSGSRELFSVSATKGAPGAGKLIDTSEKFYDATMLSGFRVNFEPGVFEKVIKSKSPLFVHFRHFWLRYSRTSL
jgi:hypothetical protein